MRDGKKGFIIQCCQVSTLFFWFISSGQITPSFKIEKNPKWSMECQKCNNSDNGRIHNGEGAAAKKDRILFWERRESPMRFGLCFKNNFVCVVVYVCLSIYGVPLGSIQKSLARASQLVTAEPSPG